MGLDRSRAIIDQDHPASLCRDAVAVMLDQSPALDSGSIAAAAEANKRLERDPTEQAILVKIRELRSKRPLVRSVAAALNRQNHQTRRGSQWRLVSVPRLIC